MLIRGMDDYVCMIIIGDFNWRFFFHFNRRQPWRTHGMTRCPVGIHSPPRIAGGRILGTTAMRWEGHWVCTELGSGLDGTWRVTFVLPATARWFHWWMWCPMVTAAMVNITRQILLGSCWIYRTTSKGVGNQLRTGGHHTWSKMYLELA